MTDSKLNGKPASRRSTDPKFEKPADIDSGALRYLYDHPEERTPCEVWSRVMGYFRPLWDWNIGKRQEHRDRKHFKEPAPESYPDYEALAEWNDAKSGEIL